MTAKWIGENALTEENLAYLVSEDGDPVADAMFLNFWWTSDTLADQELLKKSAALASENGINLMISMRV